MKPDLGTKIVVALWGLFAAVYSYLWVLDAIREHWGLLRWLALAGFLSIFIGPFFVMAYMILIKDRK